MIWFFCVKKSDIEFEFAHKWVWVCVQMSFKDFPPPNKQERMRARVGFGVCFYFGSAWIWSLTLLRWQQKRTSLSPLSPDKQKRTMLVVREASGIFVFSYRIWEMLLLWFSFIVICLHKNNDCFVLVRLVLVRLVLVRLVLVRLVLVRLVLVRLVLIFPFSVIV